MSDNNVIKLARIMLALIPEIETKNKIMTDEPMIIATRDTLLNIRFANPTISPKW